jgi:hypothetical protein
MEDQPFFGSMQNFATAYPTIETVAMKVTCTDTDTQEVFGPRIYTEKTLDQRIKCSSLYCATGYLNVAELINTMLNEGKTQDSPTQSCRGRRGSTKGQKLGDYCDCIFKCEITLTLRHNPASPAIQQAQ